MSDLFGGIKPDDFTLQQKLNEIDREIKVRRRVYPKWVAAGKLNGATADIRIKVLIGIRNDYRTKIDQGGHRGHEEKRKKERS